MAAKTRQTIDGQFLGVPSGTAPATAEPELVVEAVDSSFWIVVTNAFEDVAAIRLRFRDVRESHAALELARSLRDG